MTDSTNEASPHRTATNAPYADGTEAPRIGVCYFPEHWPRERWENDVEQMVEAGIDVVRMGEFSWARLEPERGAFDFEWLDTAVDLLGEAGIDVVLCTPTATPPKWLVDEHPSVLQEEPDGTPRAFGSRRHYCFNSAVYHDETRRIVRKMAAHYADSPHVIGWQTDNEYGCHDTIRCYCEDCAVAFREWCRERYADIDDLNETWGTTFWSQRYGSFEELDPPRHSATEHHPSRLLDYGRFASDSAVAYNQLQTDLLRAENDEWFVTHNFMGNFSTLDSYDVSDALEFATWDSYPTGFAQDRRLGPTTAERLRAGDPDQVSLNHDLYRGDEGFWVMEQQPGDINWPPYAPQPGEGAMRLWAHQAVAHGANAVCYFRWRRCREGQEQYHAGLRKHDGSPDRGYADAKQAASELTDLSLGAVDAPVALIHEYDDCWALSEQPHSPEFDYWSLLGAFYRGLRGRGVQVDIVPSDAPLDSYAAVVAPTVHLADETLASHLREFVEGGGHLLTGPRSGAKLPGNKLHPELAPGPLTDLVGGHVEQHESVPETLPTRVTYRGTEYDYRTWGEWLVAEAAAVVGTHVDGVGDGTPAILEHSFETGSVTYCGVWPETDLADALTVKVLERAGLAYTDRLPETLRVVARDGYTWVLNFGNSPVAIDAPSDADWAIGSETVQSYGVSVSTANPQELSLGHQ